MKHPLEDVFNMDEGTAFGSTYDADKFNIEDEYALTNQAAVQAEMTEAPKDLKDEDDIETEKKIDAVYEAAMQTFNNQIAYTEIIEPRYAARNAEVAANFLNTALQAAGMKAKIKTERKRANSQFIPFANGNKTTNNLIVANREDILKMIAIDGETKEIK